MSSKRNDVTKRQNQPHHRQYTEFINTKYTFCVVLQFTPHHNYDIEMTPRRHNNAIQYVTNELCEGVINANSARCYG